MIGAGVDPIRVSLISYGPSMDLLTMVKPSSKFDVYNNNWLLAGIRHRAKSLSGSKFGGVRNDDTTQVH